MQTTVQVILDTAIDLADMRRSNFIDQAGTAGTELIRYANLAYRDLYAQIVMSKEHYFTTNASIAVIAGTDSYSLPTDFYKLDGSGIDDRWRAYYNAQFSQDTLTVHPDVYKKMMRY